MTAQGRFVIYAPANNQHRYANGKLTDHFADPYNQAKLRADFVLGMAQRRLFTENESDCAPWSEGVEDHRCKGSCATAAG